MALVPNDDLSSRIKNLTPREARIFLLSGEDLSVQDIADALDLTSSVMAGARQRIRRKLGVPRGSTLVEFLDRPGVREEARLVEQATPANGEPDRRQNHALRAAIHELDQAVRRVDAKARALLATVDAADPDQREAITAEAALITTLADRLLDLRDDAIVLARASV